MSGYNGEGRANFPKTLIGNWFEELHSRGLAHAAPRPHGVYETTNHADFDDPKKIRGEISRVGPREKNREQAWMEEAKILAEKNKVVAPQPVRYKTTTGVSFGREESSLGREWFNALKADPDTIGYTTDTPITLYSTETVTGMTAATGKNPHAKNSAFSKEIGEYWGGPTKDF